jgi:hypothetical protein
MPSVIVPPRKSQKGQDTLFLLLQFEAPSQDVVAQILGYKKSQTQMAPRTLSRIKGVEVLIPSGTVKARSMILDGDLILFFFLGDSDPDLLVISLAVSEGVC